MNILEEFTQSVIYHVITGKYEVMEDGAIRKSETVDWPIKRLQDISKIENGYPFNASLFKNEGPYPVIRQGDVGSTTTQLFTNEETPAPKIESGDMLICQSGEFKMNIWQGGPSLLNQRIAVVKSENKILKFLLPIELKKLQAAKTPTTIMNLSATELRKIKIPIPPPEEAERILAFLEKFEASLPNVREALDLLDVWKKSMIYHVVTGKYEVMENGKILPRKKSGKNP